MIAVAAGPQQVGLHVGRSGTAAGGTQNPETINAVQPFERITVLHNEVQGRIRVRVDGLRSSTALKRVLEEGLPAMPGIRMVSASSLTGTVLVHFVPAISPCYVIQRIVLLMGTADSAAARNAAHYRAVGGNSAIRGHRAPIPAAGAPSFHVWDAEAVLRHFDSALIRGLTQAAAEERLRQVGGNLLPEPERPSQIKMLLRQFSGWPARLLAVSAVISMATGGMIDAAAMGCVLAFNACIGYLTESQTERTIRSLAGSVLHTAQVRRDGAVREVDAATLVPGDILVLAPGSYIAADARLLQAVNLTVNESALTGESLPVLKSSRRLANAATPLADRDNMLHRGTAITGGHGFAVVTATGRATEISQVQLLAGEVRAPETPMQRQLGVLGRQLALLGAACCGAALLIGLWRGYGGLQVLKNTIALAVAALPEGLPAMATTTLALGVRNMRRQKVLVRRLDAVETLGSMRVLCLDKTGTLTLNRMSVVAIHAGMENYRVANNRIETDWTEFTPGARATLQRLLEVVVLCNDTELINCADASSLNGSPTEAALVRLAQTFGLDISALRETRQRIESVYRAEKRKFMSTLHALDDGRTLVAVKGSPEEVLALCRWYERGTERWLLSDADRAAIAAANCRLADRALRVLGVAFAETRNNEGREEGNLVWLGLVGMADPLRQGMAGLIRSFHAAGIQTIMITGDQRATASAIARQLDLSVGATPVILDPGDLENTTPEQLAEKVRRAHVFARVSPAHKLQIVQALQRGGRVVAMTGEGINDGPALKAADVGVAMGRDGTNVARDISDIILEEDDLHAIMAAIARSRTVYSNSRKAIKYLVATNLSEILLVLGSIGAGIGQPLTPMQLLWINQISEVLPALALAQEPPEPDVLTQAPREPGAPIIGATDLGQLGLVSAIISAGPFAAYLTGRALYGSGPRAGTIAFNSLTLAQLLHAITARSERHGVLDRPGVPPNPYLWAALLGSFAAQGLAAFIPGARNLLGSAPISPLNVLLTAFAGVLPFAINEAIRTGRGRRGQEREATLSLLYGAPAAVEPDEPIKSAELAKPIETAKAAPARADKAGAAGAAARIYRLTPRHRENAADEESAAYNGKAAAGNGANTTSNRSAPAERDDNRLLIEVRAVLRQIGELGRSE